MKKVPLLLLIFGFAYFCLELIPQFTPDVIINAINVNDLIDLVITIPLTFAIFILLYHYIKTHKESKTSTLTYIRWFFLGAVFVMLVGDVMHYTANSIWAQIQHDLIYFYDEMLGHFLLYLGMYLVFIFLIVLQYYCPSQTPLVEGKGVKIPLGVSAGFLAFILAVGTIEGQQPFVTLTFSIAILIISLYLWKVKKPDLWNSPVIFYMLIFSIICLIFMCIYPIIPSIMGHPYPYAQPSELGII
ncbi:MAG: hypothetical protein HWN65_19950 [Candidatus Helarchaeota archaeon]|nr:hypothetical protein [Candidatus Helarchaeota archaeon]